MDNGTYKYVEKSPFVGLTQHCKTDSSFPSFLTFRCYFGSNKEDEATSHAACLLCWQDRPIYGSSLFPFD